MERSGERARDREKERENTGFFILPRRSINQVDINCWSFEFHLLDRYSSRHQFYFRNSFRDGLDSADVKITRVLISVSIILKFVIVSRLYVSTQFIIIWNQNYRGHVVDTFNFVLESIFDVFTRPGFPWHCASFSRGMQRLLFFNSISLIIKFHKIDFHKSICNSKKKLLKTKDWFKIKIDLKQIKWQRHKTQLYLQSWLSQRSIFWLSSATWRSPLISI